MTYRASIGIISIGEMGLGVANLLASQNYRVLSNITGRSQHTHDRAARSPITLLSTDGELVKEADYIVSIVPPKDALATAQRIVEAHPSRTASSVPLYYLDLNAIAPSSARAIASHFEPLGSSVRFVDGGIIGGPPKLSGDNSSDDASNWDRPSIVLSGPYSLSAAPKSGSHLAEVLRTRHVGDDVGVASGLKCCFASLTKGFTALAIQSFSTAARLGVLDELRQEIRESNPASEQRAIKGLVGMPPKAGRWVAEMVEIGRTFREDGGWEGVSRAEGEGGGSVFEEIAEVYKYISEDTVLGEEKSGKRDRGKTAEDVVAAILESRK